MEQSRSRFAVAILVTRQVDESQLGLADQKIARQAQPFVDRQLLPAPDAAGA